MAHDFATAYAEIIKQERQEDGTLLVYGKATDDSIDSDKQICDNEWLAKAMPDWFKSGGNIREQHSSIAAGVAKELDAKEDGWYISALVVDPTSVKKVEHQVLKGFSIGIRAPRIITDNKAAGGRIIDGQIVEVSLVDRPANPNAKLMLAKSDGADLIKTEEYLEEEIVKRDVSTEERERLASRGAAMSDGSYPIANRSDLKNAIQAFGRAKNKAAVKRHIIRRARALNAINLLPEEWNVDKAVSALIENAKSVFADTKKFDAAAYENARIALAQLVQVEGKEMEEGSNEVYSLSHLLEAVEHLEYWFMGEVSEGEATLDGEAVEETEEMESLELSNEAEVTKACDCENCKSADDCAKCDTCMEKSADKSVTAETVTETEVEEVAKSIDDAIIPEPVEENIGNVDTSIDDEEDKVSADEAEKSVSIDDAVITDIINKAVKSAKDSVINEVNSYKEEINKLQSDLATAKAQAVHSGPKRGFINKMTSDEDLERNENLMKSAEYRTKAANTDDRELAKGYLDLAKKHELLAKASK